MNITGPIQSNLPPIQESIDQFLKVNQRFAGEILHISNEQVVLAVNGIQIVAKMTSAEQLAMLMDKRYAYFVVKEISNNQVVLQLVNSIQAENPQKLVVNNTNLGQAILERIGVSVENSTLIIVQAALDQGIKITPELINDIKKVLDGLPAKWGSREANLAISIKSAGLPLTQASLSLAENAVKEIKTNFLAIYEQVEIAINRPNVSPQMQQMLRSVQSALKEAIINSGNSIENIEQNIINAVKNLGSSLENGIGKIIQSGNREDQVSKMSGLLFSISNLRHELGATNSSNLSTAIDNFLLGMRWMHFLNSEPDQPLAKGQWTQLDLPITFGFQTATHIQADNVHELQIRVAHENDQESGNPINPDYTRLTIQVDLDDNEMIKVDLSIVSNLIGAEITASNESICLNASEELSEFQTGLAKLGYTLKTSKIEIGNSKIEMNISESDKIVHSVTSVDMGV